MEAVLHFCEICKPKLLLCYPHDLLVHSLTQSIVSYYVIAYDNILAGPCTLRCLDQLIP